MMTIQTMDIDELCDTHEQEICAQTWDEILALAEKLNELRHEFHRWLLEDCVSGCSRICSHWGHDTSCIREEGDIWQWAARLEDIVEQLRSMDMDWLKLPDVSSAVERMEAAYDAYPDSWSGPWCDECKAAGVDAKTRDGDCDDCSVIYEKEKTDAEDVAEEALIMLGRECKRERGCGRCVNCICYGIVSAIRRVCIPFADRKQWAEDMEQEKIEQWEDDEYEEDV